MKTSKKMLSLLLIAAMLVSVLCMGVSASDYAEVSISEGEPVTISWSGTTGTVVSVDGSSYIPRQFILWVRNGFTVSVDGTALTPNSAPSADDTDVAYTINTDATNAITIVASNGTTTYTITCPHYTATASGTNPVAVNGPILTIRKFPSEAITMEQLIRIGSVTDDAANFLKKLVAAKYNIFVSGGTGAGKTTFLNALSNYIPKGERLITIEDNAELQIQGVQNLVRLEARGPNAEGEGAVTIRDLIKSALRMRPDRIVVGEVRGEETVDMISSAMLNGHSGSMSTGHANNPTDMLHRLETMMLMGIDLPLQAIQRQVASALDIIIHLGRLRDKTRKVLQIVEVEGYEDGKIQTKVLYEFKEEGMKNGKIQGCLMKKNEITNKEKLLAAGYHTI